MNKWIVNVVLLALVIAGANLLFFRPVGSLGVIFIWIIFTVYAVGVRREVSRVLPTLSIVIGIGIILSAALLLRSNSTAQTVLTLALFGSTAFFTYCAVTGISFVRSLAEALFMPFSLLGSYLSVLIDGMTASLSGKAGALLKGSPFSARIASRIMTLLAGLVVGIPVSVILLLLLMNADPIFAKTVDVFIKSLSLPQIGPRVVLSSIILVAAAPLMGLRIKREFSSPVTLLARPSLIPVMSVVMVLVGLVLGAFLIVQAPYVFVSVAHEMDLSKYGVATYSEYVKRGFAELLTVSVLIYGLVWLGLLAMRGKKSGQTILSGLNTFVLFELAVFILSVARRIRLYWNFHGLSLIRIYGGFFLLVIAAFTATLFLRHFFKKRWVYAEAVIVALTIAIFGWWNAEQFIVFNHPPTVNGWVDAVYLSGMSPDGYQGWEKSYIWAKEILEDEGIQSKELLSADDRRKISYAGMVTGLLSRHYHTLVLSYASRDDWRSYHREIFALQKERIDEFVPRARAELTLLQQKGSTVSGNLEPVFPREIGPEGRASTIQATLLDLERSRAWIDEQERKLASSSAADLSTKTIRFTPLRRLTRVTEGLCSHVFWDERAWYWCLPSFYATPADEGMMTKYPNALDRFVGYNQKEIEVYEWMREAIPYRKLLDLQRKYIKLYYRIIAQPENERDYQLDISPYAPFVEGL